MYYRQQLELRLKPRAVRPGPSCPPSTLSAIYQHVDKSFGKPLLLTWFPVDPCGGDLVRYLSILHCLLCHAPLRQRPLLLCQITGRMGWRSPAVPQSELFLHLLHRVSPLGPLWWGRDFSWNTNWCHLAGYFKWNGPWLPLHVLLISLLHYKLLPVLYQISSVYFAHCYFYSSILSISCPPTFFLNIELFPIKIAVIKWWDLIFLGF